MSRPRGKSKRPRRFWTEAEKALVRELYPHRPTREIAARLGRPIHSVYRIAAILDLHKTAEFRASEASGIFYPGHHRGKQTQFKTGDVPANKGLRRPGWHSGRMRETQFKKGNRSGFAADNWKPIGTILADSEGYLRIKVREAVPGKEPTGWGNVSVWPQLHRYRWEQVNGPVPRDHVLIFKDGDKNNCELENLQLLSRAENMRRNSLWKRLPRPLAKAIQLNGALKRRIRRMQREEQN